MSRKSHGGGPSLNPILQAILYDELMRIAIVTIRFASPLVDLFPQTVAQNARKAITKGSKM